MLFLRLLLFACLAVIIFALLGYSISRDRRYLRLIGVLVKGTIAMGLIMAALMLLARFLPI